MEIRKTLIFLAFCIPALFILPVSPQTLSCGTTIYVSPSGNDAWTGKSSVIGAPNGPVATLQGAQNIIRAMNGVFPKGCVLVSLLGGTYYQASSFALTSSDSGTLSSPIIYQAFNPAAVSVSGAKLLSGFTTTTDPTILTRLPAAARGNVVQADLTAAGISAGTLTKRGYDTDSAIVTSPAELVWNGQVMQLARWPATRFTNIVSSTDTTHFVFGGTPDMSWASEPDIWAHGYWTYGWAPERLPVTVSANSAVLEASYLYITTTVNSPVGVYFENILAELRVPGQYYIDRTTYILYFWPPTSSGVAEMTQLVNPIVDINGASNISFDGITFENVRGGKSINVANSTNVLIKNSVIRNTGGHGVFIAGSANSGVSSSELYAIGASGITLIGGDRSKLTPGNDFATNNSIHDYARWDRTYRPAVNLFGVGNIASHNLIHSAPHSAIIFSGNNHTISFNEIYDAGNEGHDIGIIYSGTSWTQRGNLIEYNYLHDIPSGGVAGVYLDWNLSGETVFGNIFCNISGGYAAVLVAGGRDNILKNNVFVRSNPTFRFLDRSLSDQTALLAELNTMPYTNGLWSAAYPTLPNILSDSPMAPFGNVIAYNVSSGTASGNFGALSSPHLARNDRIQEWADQSPNFVHASEIAAGCPAATHWVLDPNSSAFSNGFVAIPINQIGIDH
jgi:Right handed beta helix region